MTVEGWILTAIATLMLGILVWLAHKQLGSWLNPSSFFGGYWLVFLLFQLIVVHDFYFWPGAAWFILLFVWCLHIGVQMGWGFRARYKGINNSRGPRQYCLILGKQIIVACSILGLVTIPLVLQSQGYSLSVLLHPDAIIEVAHSFSLARYYASYELPLAAKVATTLTYLAAMFGGIWVAVNRRRSRLVGFLPFLPAFGYALILTTRTSVLYPLLFFTGTFLATLVLNRTRIQLTSFRVITSAALLIISLFVFVTSLWMVRSRSGFSNVSTAIIVGQVTVAGSPAVFSQWLEGTWTVMESPGWGAEDIAGVFDLLGIQPRAQGLYVKAVSLGEYQTNIYTVFRGLIDDFTLPGMLFVLLAVGLVGGYAYGKVVEGRSSWLPILAFFYAFTLWSGVTSILNYNTFLVAMSIFLFLLSGIGPFMLRLVKSEFPRSKPETES